MPMIPARSAEKNVYGTALKLKDGYTISIKSFKKDRVITITKHRNSYVIVENGFSKGRFEASGDELKKRIKELISKEFPRSHELSVAVKSTTQ